MDFSSSLLQHQDNTTTTAFLFDCENLLEQSYATSDPGYHSGCGSLSPASSVDSCLFSPPFFHFEPIQESFHFKSACTQEEEEEEEKKKQKAKPAKRTGRPRSKFPGLKRQTASEREKLRMRDLTKALNNLRTFLPPSVAPVGQTLTKIETLRLTIHYISYLSTQLGLSEGDDACRNLSNLTPVPKTPATFQTENLQPVSSESVSTQEIFCTPESSFQNPHHAAFPPSPSQEYWFPQEQYSFYGHC